MKTLTLLSTSLALLLVAARPASAQSTGLYAYDGAGASIPDAIGANWPHQFPILYAQSFIVVPPTAKSIDAVHILGLQHARAGDLHAVLVAPNGSQYTLIHRLGSNGATTGFTADFAGDYAIDSTAVAAWPQSDPGPSAQIPTGTYPEAFGAWVHGTEQIFNVPVRTFLDVLPGLWTLRIYDWNPGAQGHFAGWRMAGKRLHGFNVDFNTFFGPGAGVPSSSYAAAGHAGFWNSVNLSIPGALPLTADDGTSTKPAMLESLVGPFSNLLTENAATTGDDDRLLDDAAAKSLPIRLRIGNLHPGRWGVHVYAFEPLSSSQHVFVNAVTVHGGTKGTKSVGAPWSGAHQEGGSYAYDEVLVTAGAIEFTVESLSFFNASIGGFQLRYLGNDVVHYQAYCTPTTPSINGCIGTLTAGGTLSASSLGDYWIAASGIDGKRNGGFLYGAGPKQPFTGSNPLCVTAPVQRLGLLNSGGTQGQCDGSMGINLSSWIASHPNAHHLPLFAGQTLYCQAWYRDNGSPLNTMATNAIAVAVVP